MGTRSFGTRFWGLALASALLAVSCGSSTTTIVEPDAAAPAADDEPAPEAEPIEEPTEEPTAEPTPEPTEEPTPVPTEEPAPDPTEEPTPEPTEEPAEAIVLGEPDADGVVAVSIDVAQLAPLFDDFTGGDDPFYLVHTQQDDVFVSVELYTVFGDGWTGELGTFPADCTTHGICVYLDPDGTGPLPGGGPGTGTLTVVQLEGGSIITLDDVEILATDGQVYTMSGLTLTG